MVTDRVTAYRTIKLKHFRLS